MLSTKFSGDVILRNKQLGLSEYKFLVRAIVSSGIGEETYAPKMVFEGREACPKQEDGLMEMDEFFLVSIDRLFKRSGISPSEIDILVVNVSMLASIPSLASRIINLYKMREDVKVYNITGMGCSASMISDITKFCSNDKQLPRKTYQVGNLSNIILSARVTHFVVSIGRGVLHLQYPVNKEISQRASGLSRRRPSDA
ncbi:3-ketoacyl-CoA synthase 3-like [Dorcoceras hygrometricum]|uniref:3-ketoacyl-CoA synthase 3-like n=1 Tax=Dorcoceras hygrometricum TaxID=472368 RepID=A0A2Z7B3U9_9LAMI|nr:3-ketoacyl-CoA synthase 3-like [Dorcoceras hygrometricum]